MRGNYARGSGLLDALSRGDYAPEPEVVRTDPSGRDVVHRIVAVLVGDPRGARRRRAAQVEPQLDAWVGTQLPDPRNVRCTASYTDVGGTTHETVVRLSDLDLEPLDLVALADGQTWAPAASSSSGSATRRAACGAWIRPS